MTRWRNVWVEDAAARDMGSVTRWFVLTIRAKLDGESTLLYRRILGWDATATPAWLEEGQADRVTLELEELPKTALLQALDASTRDAVVDGTREVRRLELPVADWLDGPSSETWDLHVPVVAYEVWAADRTHDLAASVWAELSEPERAYTHLPLGQVGYLGSTIVLLPQSRPHFRDMHNLVIPAGEGPLQDYSLLSEVSDGPLVLARNVSHLVTEPWSQDKSKDALGYLRIHYSTAGLAGMNERSICARPHALAAYPGDRHGFSGSDWRLTLVRSDGIVAVSTVGLIRGLGNGYITTEPWRHRAPAFGFSAPARVIHVPPTNEAATSAFAELTRAGSPASIADPFATAESLDRIRSILRKGRLLTKPNPNSRGVSPDWARANELTVRVVPDLHDRFVVGRRSGFLLGTSLNGLGNKHSFLVGLDSVMQSQVTAVFEGLWSDAGSLEDPTGPAT